MGLPPKLKLAIMKKKLAGCNVNKKFYRLALEDPSMTSLGNAVTSSLSFEEISCRGNHSRSESATFFDSLCPESNIVPKALPQSQACTIPSPPNAAQTHSPALPCPDRPVADSGSRPTQGKLSEEKAIFPVHIA
jgi:hypothetical protein